MPSLALLALLASGTEDSGHGVLPRHPLRLSSSTDLGSIQGTREDLVLGVVRSRDFHALDSPHLPMGTDAAPAQLHTT